MIHLQTLSAFNTDKFIMDDIMEDPVEEKEEEINNEEAKDENVEDLKDQLSAIDVTMEIATLEKQPKLDYSEYPTSYKENTNKEKLVLSHCENFRRQYVHLFRDRKPLFLTPLNECGVEKFVSTTLRPTLLEYKELYRWDGCAEFVSDYLTMQLLNPPTDLPRALFSPTAILKEQKGNSFDFSSILCSLLLGAGYDAYVVSGYATKEVCMMDETREICPLLRKKEEVKAEPPKKVVKKYGVKPPRDLRSKFILKMEARKKKEEEDEIENKKKEEEQRILELEKPPPDALFGLRIHAWVLIRAGKREVSEDFFIEPFTGIAFKPSSRKFLGIESVWNHANYWSIMQECSNGCKDLSFDLQDSEKWEYMFQGGDKSDNGIVNVDEELYELDDFDEEDKEEDKQLDMPASWCLPIEISKRDYEMRCPNGKKTILYKKARLQKYAPYLMKNGLTQSLSIFYDRDLTQLDCTKDWFANRADKLELRTICSSGLITERYVEGRPSSLSQHVYKENSPGPESERMMEFYHNARVDGLSKREESMSEMKEHFINREDFLYLRHVYFGKRQKKVAPVGDVNLRPILKIIEKFYNNPNSNTDENVQERLFILSEDKIHLTFHRDGKCVTASTREFYKPPKAEEKTGNMQWSPDMTTSFQVEPHEPSPKNLVIYNQLVNLIQAEQKSIQAVRQSEEEVKEILLDRKKEEVASELEINVYDTERNEKAKQKRKELERMALEEKQRRQEMEMDYLAPFLAQIGNPERILRTQAFKLKEDCMSDLKQRLIDKANLIQLRFEKETTELHRRQQEYQQKQVSMTKEDEEEYFNFCSEAMFRIHILELRLNRHKQMAPQKYMQLEQKLKQDPRLSQHF